MKPAHIQVDTQQKTLHLRWPDGIEQIITHQTLRGQCPCGFCRAKRLKQQLILVPEEIQITAIYDQGYGAQICFSDGHDKGIFPWIYLQELATA